MAHHTGYEEALRRIAEARKTGAIELDLSSLNLPTIPVELSGYHALQTLNLLGNQISRIENLPDGLQTLDLSEKKISRIENLPDGLQTLDLSENKISQLENLPDGLQTLDLSENKISRIENLPDGLQTLNLSENSIQNFPIELLGNSSDHNCLKAWKAWNADLAQGKAVNRTVRLLVTGNGNVGKSSVIEALKKGKCDKEFQSTHAIQIETLDLLGSEEPVTVQVFDFGGQEIYMGTHSLFLRGQAVQMIVFDDQTEAKPTVKDRVTGEDIRNPPLEYWLEKIEQQAEWSKYIIVRNKIDTLTKNSKNKRQLLNERRKQGDSVVEVSAIDGIGVTDLKRVLRQAACNLPEYGMEMPASWDAVRQHFFKNLKQHSRDRQRLMRHADFLNLCDIKKVTVGSEKSLLRYLHHTGVVYYHENYLPDTLILDQEWAIAAIYVALDRSGALYKQFSQEKHGWCVANDLFKAFGEGYDSQQCWLLLHFMESCGLCFPVKDENYKNNNSETTYIFPEFLATQIPSTVLEFNLKPGLRVFHQTHNFLPYAHVQQAISRWGLKTYFYNVGRSGLFVETPKGQFSLTATENRLTLFVEATMSTEGIDDLQRQFSYKYSKWQERSRFILWAEKLWNALTGKSNVEKLVKPADMQNRLSSEKAMYDNTPDVLQPTTRKMVVSYSHKYESFCKALDVHLGLLKNKKIIDVWHDRKILAGKKWNATIQQKFEEADIIVLMISAPFLNSPYIWEQELRIARERLEKQDGVLVIPILTGNCYIKGLDFMDYQAAQRDHQSEFLWLEDVPEEKRNRIYANIVAEIHESIKAMR